jgi:hypothetical protein
MFELRKIIFQWPTCWWLGINRISQSVRVTQENQSMADGERGWWCVIPCHHPCFMPRQLSWHLMMKCHVTSTSMCHEMSTSMCHTMSVIATSTNRSSQWWMARSVDLRKCFRQFSGIVDHRCDDGQTSVELVRSFSQQQISLMSDSRIGQFRFVYKSVVRGMGRWLTIMSIDQGKVGVPKEECWSLMVDVVNINGSGSILFDINVSYLKGCYSSKTINFKQFFCGFWRSLTCRALLRP